MPPAGSAPRRVRPPWTRLAAASGVHGPHREAFRAPAADEAIVEALHRHGVQVAHLARRMAEQMAQPLDLVSAAALLHDIGLWVLAGRADLQSAALDEEEVLCQRERAAHGFTHAEAGAYLLGIWGLPLAIIDAVAHHHGEPPPGGAAGPSDLVSLAELLLKEQRAGAPVPAVEARAAALGLSGRLPEWRALAAGLGRNPGTAP